MMSFFGALTFLKYLKFLILIIDIVDEMDYRGATAPNN